MLAQGPYSGGASGLVVGRAVSVPLVPAEPGAGLRLPSHESVVYTRDLLVLVLFVIAFPWVLHKLLTQPAKLLQGTGVKAGL